MATHKIKTGNAQISAAQLRQARKSLPIGADFVLLMLREGAGVQVRPGDEASTLLKKAAVALRSPGIARASVFRGVAAHQKKVFAYSTHPADSNLLIREAEDGTREVGKIGADGRFRISRKPI